jgi:NAD(P)-dependent dehydrogenase (short-subunit alcohol dehydrogenase family)
MRAQQIADAVLLRNDQGLRQSHGSQMHVLLTGAFGHVGTYTLPELLGQGYQVRCLDLSSPLAEKQANRAGRGEAVRSTPYFAP